MGDHWIIHVMGSSGVKTFYRPNEQALGLETAMLSSQVDQTQAR
jgi:hypothetical protein